MSIVQALEALLLKTPGAEPEYLEVIQPDGDRLVDGAWEALEERYAEAVESVAASWGPPVFHGGWNDGEFPRWHHWVAHLTYWRRGSDIAFIECDHPDNELAAVLCIGVLTEAEQVAAMQETDE